MIAKYVCSSHSLLIHVYMQQCNYAHYFNRAFQIEEQCASIRKYIWVRTSQKTSLHFTDRSSFGKHRTFQEENVMCALSPVWGFCQDLQNRSPTACCHLKRTKDLEKLPEESDSSEYVHLEKSKKPKKKKPREHWTMRFSFFGYGCSTIVFFLLVRLQ